ncbi:MAG: transposase [Dissulfurispiraceae bacterium]
MAKYYWKLFFWNGAYYVGSVVSVTLGTIRRYVEQQNTKSRPEPAA